jgi:hypothetical protein
MNRLEYAVGQFLIYIAKFLSQTRAHRYATKAPALTSVGTDNFHGGGLEPSIQHLFGLQDGQRLERNQSVGKM